MDAGPSFGPYTVGVTGTWTPIRRLVFCEFDRTPSMYGVLLIFFSPMNRESVICPFKGTCRPALEVAGCAVGAAACGLSCATAGVRALPASASASTSSFLIQHTPLSWSASVDVGRASVFVTRQDERVDRERRDLQ